MECLFKTTTKFTLDEYSKFNWTIVKKRHMVLLSILVVICFLLSGYLLQNNLLVVLAIIYPILFFIALRIGVNRVFNSNKLMQNVDVTYEFYNDYLQEKHEGGETKVPYDKISEIIETKTNFYLMIANNQGFMISKANMPEGLDEFIRSKKK